MIRVIAIFLLTISTAFGQFGQTPFGHVQVSAVLDTAWQPTDDATLELWLRADDFSATYSDSQAITTAWLDTSGNGNDATVSGNPYFISNLLNGHAGVRFDGSGDFFTTQIDTSHNVSVYIVSNSKTSGTNAGLVSMQASGTNKGWVIFASSADNRKARLLTGSVFNFVYSGVKGNQPMQIISFIKQSDSAWVSINGVTGTGVAGSVIFNDKNIRIGAYYTNDVTFLQIGDVVEVLVFNQKHNSSEQSQVESYLTEKYFPDPGIPTDSLQVWLAADDISGADDSEITDTWINKGYYFGHDAVVSGNPTIQVNEVNGHRAIDFDGTLDYFTGSWDTSATFTAFIVQQADPLGVGFQGALSSASTSLGGVAGWDYEYNSSKVALLRQGNSTTSTSTNLGGSGTRPWQLIRIRRNNGTTTTTVYTDGVLSGTESSQTITYADKLYSVGRLYTSLTTLCYTGQIAEVLIYNKYMSTSDISTIETYLNSKYGL